MFFENEELDFEEGDEIVENENSKNTDKNMDLTEDDDFLEIKLNANEIQEINEEVNTGKEKNPKPKNEEKNEKNKRREEKNSNKKKFFKKKIYSNKKPESFHKLSKGNCNQCTRSALWSKNSSEGLKKRNMSKPFKDIKHQPFSNSFKETLIGNRMNLPLSQNFISEQQFLSSFWSSPNLLHQNNLNNFHNNLLQLRNLFPSVSVPELKFPEWPPSVQSQFSVLYEQPPPNTSVNNKCKTDLNLLLEGVKKKNPFDEKETLAMSAPSGLFSNVGCVGTDFNQPSSNNTYTEMEESEKNMINIKKEARLKRFRNEDEIKNLSNGNDYVSQKKIIINRNNQTSKNGPTHLVENNSQTGKTLKTTEKRGGIFSTDSSLVKHPTKTLDIHFETPQVTIPKLRTEILNKKNPFDTWQLNSIQIKKEKTDEDQSKLSSAEGKMFGFLKTRALGSGTNQEGILNGCDRSNNEKDTKVKFVRTISKSFDDLGLFKPLMENSTQAQIISSPLQPELATPFLDKLILTGCIAKVLNIPKNTTTNDILELCNPVGKVLELKLNVPKENSAVIRFADSGCAENFYALYHGQKYGGNFLNVIIV